MSDDLNLMISLCSIPYIVVGVLLSGIYRACNSDTDAQTNTDYIPITVLIALFWPFIIAIGVVIGILFFIFMIPSWICGAFKKRKIQ